MNLEVGMYVKTNEGIGTVQRIYNNKNDCTVRFKKGHVKKWVTILKASHNIIDLIEAGDYVNGFPVIHKENDILKCGLLVQFKENEIKSIVTKEQFESIKYSLEG